MAEDARYDVRLMDEADDLHFTAASGTAERVNFPDLFYELPPSLKTPALEGCLGLWKQFSDKIHSRGTGANDCLSVLDELSPTNIHIGTIREVEPDDVDDGEAGIAKSVDQSDHVGNDIHRSCKLDR